MTKICAKPVWLPDIEMIAGDTTPWNVDIVDDAGRARTGLGDITASLAFTPIGFAGTSVVSMDKSGAVSISPDGSTHVVFSFSVSDTLDLMGKYIYQITVDNGSDRRVRQGFVTIKSSVGGRLGL